MYKILPVGTTGIVLASDIYIRKEGLKLTSYLSTLEVRRSIVEKNQKVQREIRQYSRKENKKDKVSS